MPDENIHPVTESLVLALHQVKRAAELESQLCKPGTRVRAMTEQDAIKARNTIAQIISELLTIEGVEEQMQELISQLDD